MSIKNPQGEQNQITETYILSAVPSIKQAVTNLGEMLGMQPTDRTVKDGATAHQLAMVGTFVGGVPCLARSRMVYDPSSGVTLELVVRTGHPYVSQKLSNGIQ